MRTSDRVNFGAVKTIDLAALKAVARPDSDWMLGRTGIFLEHLGVISSPGNSLPERKNRHIAFVAPQLPHTCELELWNGVAKKLDARAVVLTAKTEKPLFDAFSRDLVGNGNPIAIEMIGLDSVSENRSFLAGLDEHLTDASLVISVGETSLATYQVVKARRQLQHKLMVWQTTPRPPEAIPGSRGNAGNPLPDLARVKTIRREILKTCDALVCFDKDSSSWAYLEGVNAQRIRRITRGVNLKRFSIEMNATQRIALRQSLGLPEADFIFLQSGPLELESGALDSVYSFKSLLQSNPAYMNNTKLVFCGVGSAGADVRQAVVDLQLDDHVFFLNPNDPGTREMIGNQMANLLAICDAVIHNPIHPVNGTSSRNLDCTYDILCALGSGLTVVSNGNGWVGDWMSRFFKVFAAGNIHGQARLMRECIDKQEKLMGLKRSARIAMESELSLEKATSEMAAVVQGLLETEIRGNSEDIAELLSNIDELVKAKKYLDAIQLISKGFENPALTPSQRSILFRNIGDCFTKLGDLENGLQNYLRALELDPYCAKSLIGLGTVALQRRDYNVAVPHFQKAITLAPNDDLASLGLALAFEGLGELKHALQWTTRSCELNIENTAAIFTLVRLSYDLDEFAAAELLLSHYISLHPYDVNMTFTLGGVAFQLGKIDMATRLMETILMLDPMNSRAHGLLQQIQRKSEQRKQA
jgi:tetratricopeptide (TPR) repeat protein